MEALEPKPAAHPRSSVLIADDDRALCASLRDILEAKRHQVTVAYSGQEALEACSRLAFDVLLLDVSLPDISGLELISQVEEIQPELEILVITGHASEETAIRAVSRGTVGYLVKPLDLDRLLEILDGVARRRRIVRENRRLAESIRAAREQWETTFHAIPDPIAVVGEEGGILRANRAFCDRFGRRPGEIVGAQAAGIVFGGAAASQAALPLAGKAAVEEREDLAVPGVFEVAVHPAHLELELGSILVLRDVTERRNAAAERESLIEELERKNRELERYAFTVSHDLKSPLITILGFLDLVEENARAGRLDQLEADLEHIRQAARRMKDLLGQLLELSRVGRVLSPPEDVSLAALAREAAELVAPAPGRPPARIEVSEDLPVVRVDRLRLLQVYQNLIDNAVKYMGDQPRPRIEIGVRGAGYERVFFVADNGIGIDPAQQERVFGMFDKLDGASRGTGIGLALVRRIIEVHGGRVWIESAGRGKGSRVCFTLP